MARPSFQIEDDAADWVESRLIQGQTKSVWYRYATRTAMQVDPILDELFEPYQYDERQELVEAAVRKEVDRRLSEADRGSGDQ